MPKVQIRLNFVGILGTSLVIVNAFSSGMLANIWSFVTTGKGTGKTSLQQDVLLLGGELVFVIVASVVAEASDAAEELIAALLIALWFVWTINNTSAISSFVNAVTATTQPKNTASTNIPNTHTASVIAPHLAQKVG